MNNLVLLSLLAVASCKAPSERADSTPAPAAKTIEPSTVPAPPEPKQAAKPPPAAVSAPGVCCCKHEVTTPFTLDTRDECSHSGKCTAWTGCGLKSEPSMLATGQAIDGSWDEPAMAPVLWLAPSLVVPLELVTNGSEGSGTLRARVNDRWKVVGSFSYNSARGGEIRFEHRTDGSLLFRSSITGHGAEPTEVDAVLLAIERLEVKPIKKWSCSEAAAPAWANVQRSLSAGFRKSTAAP